MFKQLSQIGKNLTDELAKGLAEDLTVSQDQLDSNSDLPKEIQAKLKKFEKYEQKYPLLLNAYKNEKLKSEQFDKVQQILTENTPIASVDDHESLITFFQNVEMKTTMLNDEIKRLTTEQSENQKKIQELESKLEASPVTETPDPSNADSDTSKLETELEKLKSELEEKSKLYKSENEALLKRASEEEEKGRKLEEKYASEIQQLEANHKKELKLKDEKITETISSLKNCEVSLQGTEEALKKQKDISDNLSKELDTQRSENSRNEKLVQSFKEKINELIEERDTRPEEEKSMAGAKVSTPTSNLSKSKKKKNKKNRAKKASDPSEEVHSEESQAFQEKSSSPGDAALAIEAKVRYEQLLEDFNKLKELQKESEDWKIKYESLVLQTKDLEGVEARAKQLSEQLAGLQSEYEDLQAAHKDLQSSLKSKIEELDNVKDMLKEVGNELVEAKDQIKNANGVKNHEVEDLKMQLESLRNNNSDVIKNYEKNLNELNKKVADVNERKVKLENETKTLQTALAKSNQEKDKLEKNLSESKESISKIRKENSTLADQLREYNSLKKNESVMKLSITQKEKTISYLEQQIRDYNVKEETTKNSLRDAKLENKHLSKKLDTLTKENESLKKDVKKNDGSLEQYIKENGKLSERLDILQEKHDTLQNMKSNSNDQVDSIRRQCEELNVKLKESNKRILSLEDELNESTSILQERTRETNTMRRLLADSENDRGIKLKELQEKFAITLEEKSKLQSELTLQTSRKTREIQELRELNMELKSEIHTLNLKIKQQQSEIEHLSSVNRNMQRKSSASAESSGELDNVVSSLKEALSRSEKKIRDTENINEELKDLNKDLNKKLDRLSKNYKTVSTQLNRLKEGNSPVPPSRSNSSTFTLSDDASDSVSRRPSLVNESSSNTVSTDTRSELNEKIAYIKNVLLGFLEHREQRSQLLPVVSMLLHLDSNDEKRLLMSLR